MGTSLLNVISTDSEVWRAETEAHFTLDRAVVEARLEDLTAKARAAGLVATFGFEAEISLIGRQRPSKEQVYEEVLYELCNEVLPEPSGKGRILDPQSYRFPFVMSQWDEENRTYNHDQRGSSIIEVASGSGEHRDTTDRYWRFLAVAGEVAASHNCTVAVLDTHLSGVLYKIGDDGTLQPIANQAGNQALVATQYARRHLQPFELAYRASRACETLPSKTGRWAVGVLRNEGRYPAYGVVDLTIDMLGALGGLSLYIEGAIPEIDKASLHACEPISFWRRSVDVERLGKPLFGALDGLVMLDLETNQLILPANFTRSNIKAAAGSKRLLKLDELVTSLSNGSVTDFSQNNAELLRAILAAFFYDQPNDTIHFHEDVPYSDALDSHMEGVQALRSTASVRIDAGSPYDTSGHTVANRQLATTSPVVAEILGQDVMDVLAPADQAHQRLTARQQTWPTSQH